MTARGSLLALTLGLALLLVPRSDAAGQAPAVPGVRPALAAFLTKYLQFSNADLITLSRGEIVAKTMPAADSREVAVAGALRFEIPVAFYLDRLRDIAKFKASHDVFQVGVFSTPAVPSDLAPLVLDPRDVDDLRRCTPGHCKVRLDAAAMARFQKEVNWTDAARTSEEAHRLAREVLSGYVAAYQHSGNAALVEYRDTDPPIRLAEQTKLLLTRSAYLNLVNPALRDHLDGYPRAASANVEDIMYWSKETFGMKPIVTATHLTIWKNPTDLADAFVTSKQLYSTHYFDASLAVTLATATGAPDQPGTIIVYINRSLVDALQGGLLGMLKRPIARSKARGGLDEHLVALKKRLEAEYRAKK